ncbi:MAG TPA: nuclear transport factor 2 family protein [Inquilinus sp.]
MMAAKLREAPLSASMPAMSLSDLPDPIRSFLRAVQAGDGAALGGTLEDGAVLTDDDRDYSSDAVSGWLDGLSRRRIRTMRPIDEAKRRSEIVVTILTIEPDAGGRDTELLHEWRFTARAGRIASVRMARRANPILPWVVAAFVRAANCLDLEGLLATLADDALVNDQLCDHWGKQAIREWAAREIIGERLALHVVDVVEHRSHVVVTANINGDFDRRGLPDPLVLSFYFSLLGEQIEQLIILRNQPRS